MLLDVNGFQYEAVFSRGTLDNVIRPLLDLFMKRRKALGRRMIVFLAAPPGAGKSTLGLFMEAYARREGYPYRLRCVSIDGFHYTNAQLRKMTVKRPEGLVPASSVKGSAETFDTAALKKKLSCLRTEETVLFPYYDRKLHDPVPDALPVGEEIVLLEGNWLLYPHFGFEELPAFADLTIFLDADPEELKEGLVQRKERGGMSREQAEAWVAYTDGPNIGKAREDRKDADVLLVRTGIGTLLAKKLPEC